MDAYIKSIKQILVRDQNWDLQKFLKLIYFSIPKRDDLSGMLAHYEKEVEESMVMLDFPKRNAIGCAVNALCAEIEYAAFTEGFQKGAALILSLLQQDMD